MPNLHILKLLRHKDNRIPVLCFTRFSFSYVVEAVLVNSRRYHVPGGYAMPTSYTPYLGNHCNYFADWFPFFRNFTFALLI